MCASHSPRREGKRIGVSGKRVGVLAYRRIVRVAW